MEGRPPIELATPEEEKTMKVGDGLFVIGHPIGLPAKIALDGKVTEVSKKVFESDLDIFYNNSGSPVFSQSTHKVIGILVDGYDDDFVYDRSRKCWKSYTCKEADCFGNGSARVGLVRPWYP